MSTSSPSITDISSSLVIPGSLVATVLSIFVVISVKRCRQNSNNRTTGIRFEDKMLYSNVEGNMADFSSTAEDWMLPNWLQEKKAMIFPRKSILKGELLGRGNFGSVFKGKLIQGNAVYAIRYIYYCFRFSYANNFTIRLET